MSCPIVTDREQPAFKCKQTFPSVAAEGLTNFDVKVSVREIPEARRLVEEPPPHYKPRESSCEDFNSPTHTAVLTAPSFLDTQHSNGSSNDLYSELEDLSGKTGPVPFSAPDITPPLQTESLQTGLISLLVPAATSEESLQILKREVSKLTHRLDNLKERLSSSFLNDSQVIPRSNSLSTPSSFVSPKFQNLPQTCSGARVRFSLPTTPGAYPIVKRHILQELPHSGEGEEDEDYVDMSGFEKGEVTEMTKGEMPCSQVTQDEQGFKLKSGAFDEKAVTEDLKQSLQLPYENYKVERVKVMKSGRILITMTDAENRHRDYTLQRKYFKPECGFFLVQTFPNLTGRLELFRLEHTFFGPPVIFLISNRLSQIPELT